MRHRRDYLMLTFGKHKGKLLGQVDDDYLQWLTTTDQEFLAKAAAAVLEEKNPKKVLDFGKHKGKPIGQVDDAYLQWMLKTHTESSWWGKAAAEVLKARGADFRQQGEGYKRSKEAKNEHHLLADLKLCSITRNLEWGRQIHAQVLEGGNVSSIHVATALVKMYANCGSMVDARWVFDSMKRPDVVLWTTMLLGYAENGEGLIALDLFSRMKSHGCVPDSIAYMAALKACTSLATEQDASGRADCLQWGRQIHLEIGCHLNLKLQNTLIDMYAKCGSTVDAHRVFDNISNPNVVSWNNLLLAYAANGQGVIALNLFSRMKCLGFGPDSITYVAALKACTSLAVNKHGAGRADCLERGKCIHSEIGCQMNLLVQNALIDMYAKCGSMTDAHRLFDTIRHPDVVSWNSLLLGYADRGDGFVALELFLRMQSQGCLPGSRTYMGALKACGLLGALEYGRKVHSEISEFDAYVVTCLVDFYARCGSMVEAREVFDSHHKTRRLSAWNALLAGYASFGDADSVFGLLEGLQDAGLQPDGVTLVCLLQCCSHAGLVETAREYFEAMPATYGLTQTVEHFTCMVDLLGRANKLDEALAMLERMPCLPDVVTWTAVLAACCKWKNVETGRLAFQSLVSLDETDGAAYVLMAQLYGSRGMWEEQEAVLGMRQKARARKLPEQAYWTDKSGKVVTFLAGDVDLSELMSHAAESYSRSHTVGGIEKQAALCGHSEKQAVAYAILNTDPGETVSVVKNLRVCDDCHKTLMLVSKTERRIIVVRDSSTLHVFKHGRCACGDQ